MVPSNSGFSLNSEQFYSTELNSIMTDPVAEKSTFLCMYMSNHPDTLVAYVKYWGKISEAVVSAKMSAIDSKVSAKSIQNTALSQERKMLRKMNLGNELEV